VMTLRGVPAAPGIAIGKAYRFDHEEPLVPRRPITAKQVPEEVRRFRRALELTRDQLQQLQERVGREIGAKQAEIFQAHLLVLEDEVFLEKVLSAIKREKVGVEFLVMEVVKQYLQALAKIDDEYLRERMSDIRDVGRRLLRNLLGIEHTTLRQLPEPVIVVAHDISPSDTASMHGGHVLGFVTDVGGRTSHTAIMAKSLEIPAVVGLEMAMSQIATGDTVIIDGFHGAVFIKPDQATIRRYQRAQVRVREQGRSLNKLRDLPAETVDGHRVTLAANIELADEVASVVSHGAEGVGLYRTEFFYMNRPDLPSEEEHYLAYKKVIEKTGGHPVVIRTLDLGGDKFLSQLEVPREMNPYLGWRAIRFCLARPDIFKTQLRAALRASIHGKMKLMYPMISGLEELQQANQCLDEVKQQLRRKRVPFDEQVEVGAMIEVPSAALSCDLLAPEVQFFSIGTNDLIQYTLAVDRANEKIAYLYEPTHPAVLRMIKQIIETGHQAGIWVGMCGEMAGEPAFALLLLGLGLDEFSVPPALVPEVKRLVRSVTLEQARVIAEQVLGLRTGREIERFLQARLQEVVGAKDTDDIVAGLRA